MCRKSRCVPRAPPPIFFCFLLFPFAVRHEQTGAAAKDGFVAGVLENSQPENKDWVKVVVSIASR